MARKKKQPFSRFASEAALQALLRFGPEESGLAELVRAAEGAYSTSVKQARGTADLAVQQASAARPRVQEIYEKGGLAQARAAHSLVGQDLARLGSAADPFKAAASLEQASQISNLAGAQSSALTDLETRKVAARTGGQFAVENARSQFVDQLSKVLARKQDLAREKGAFTALTTGQLTDAARKRADDLRIDNRRIDQSERSSQRSAGIDPDTGLPIPGGKLDPKAKNRGKLSGTGAKLLSPDKHFATKTEIEQIASHAAKYRGKLSRQQIVKKLTAGRPQQRIAVDPDTGEKLPNPVSLPAIPAFQPDIRMTAALDVALDGHLSRKTQRALQDAGFKIKDLGLPSYGEWKRAQKGRRRPAVGQVIQQGLGSVPRIGL